MCLPLGVGVENVKDIQSKKNDTFRGSGNRKKKNDEEEKTSSCPARDLDEG